MSKGCIIDWIRVRRYWRWLCVPLLACLAFGNGRAATADATGNAAQYLLDHWTTADGLPVNGVNRVLLARSGYLWLATLDGLVRFDGHRFSVFRAGPQNPGLPGNRIVEMVESRDAQLWLLTETGALVRFDGRAFHTIAKADGLTEPVEFFHLDSAGTLWVATRHAVAHLLDDNVFAVLPGSAQLGSINGIGSTAVHTVWVATDTGVYEFVNERLRRHLGADDGVPLPAVSVAQDGDGRVWVASRTRVVREQANGRLQTVLDAPNLSRIAVLGDAIIVNGGTQDYTVDLEGKVHSRTHSATIAGSAPETRAGLDVDGRTWRKELNRLERDGQIVFEAPCAITDFAFGADGAVWVTTACSGVYALRPRHIFAITAVDGIELGSTYSLAQARDGTLWIGTLSHGVATVSPDGAERWLRDTDAANPIIGQFAIATDPRDGIWIGACRVIGPAQCATPADWPAALDAKDIVQAIHRARDGSLWVGGRDLWQQTATGQWHDWSADAGLGSGAKNDRVRAILESDDGTLWLASYGAGVVRRDRAGNFRRFNDADALSSNAIRALRADSRNQMWIATQDRGLCRMQAPESTTPRIACIDQTRGLWSDSLHQILFDDQGRMWLNSNDGIFAMPVASVDAVLDRRAERVYPQVYTERDGLPSREGNGGVDHAGIKLVDGRMAFPTAAGVAIFNPHDLPSPQGQVRAVFERLSLPDGKSVAASANMNLPRGMRSFTVHYTGLAPHLTAPAYFRYRVLPDAGWIDVGDARQISLSSLSPGKRNIELVALGSDGKAGPAARIILDLPRFWYETGTFRVGVPMLVLLIVIWWLWHLRRASQIRQRLLEHRVEERTGELRGALQTIEQLAQSKTRFFANVSHELRTPLALLIGPIDDYARGRAPSKPLLRAMQRNAHRLERLIGQLLDLERIDVRHFPLRPQLLDLAMLARENIIAFESLAEREQIHLAAHLPDAPLPVRGDCEQLMRVIGNLLSNALKFCPQGGRVEVTLEVAHDQSIRLRVDDTGPGIAADWRERIFDRFSQIGSAATRQREGAGLGLALCREVAGLHGGHLYATDGVLGGASVVFELPPPARSPLIECSEDRTATVNIAGAEPAGGAPPPSDEDVAVDCGLDASDDAHRVADDRALVLLAEDNPDLRHYLTGILSAHYRVAATADGAIALQQARAELPDLVVTDAMMPNLDGMGLARALRSEAELAGVPIVFLTARAADADQIAGLEGGADYYLTKPFDSQVLLAQLRAALRACQRLRERYAQRTPVLDADTSSEATKSAFVQRLEAVFEARAHEPEFDIAALCAALHTSESALRRQCREECQASPGELLRRHRLERAHGLLAAGAGSVSEVAYGVGYTSLSSFSRAYREHFQHAPTRPTV